MNEIITYLIPSNVRMGVYKLTAPDGSYCIGSTKDLYKRYRQHLDNLRNGRHSNTLIRHKHRIHPDWIWKYELIEATDHIDNLLTIEQKHLDIHYGQLGCINRVPVASKPPTNTTSTSYNLGTKQSEETCIKKSRSHTGIKLSSDHSVRIKLGRLVSGNIKKANIDKEVLKSVLNDPALPKEYYDMGMRYLNGLVPAYTGR